MTEDRISFKDMCARFEVTPRTLRYYEYIELLSPRREGRARWYGPREIARMKLIMRGRRFGFSLGGRGFAQHRLDRRFRSAQIDARGRGAGRS